MTNSILPLPFELELGKPNNDCISHIIYFPSGDDIPVPKGDYNDILRRALGDLTSSFGLHIYTPDSFINAYKSSGYLEDHVDIIWWSNGDFIIQHPNEAGGVIKRVIDRLNTIIIGNNWLELKAKALWLTRNSLWKYQDGYYAYTPFALHSIPFNKNLITFEFRVDAARVMGTRDSAGVIFKCAVEFNDNSPAILFDVFAFSVDLFTKYRTPNYNHTYNTCILFTKLNIKQLITYLEESIAHIKASSKDELLLKLCTFSNTLYESRLLSTPMTPGQQYRPQYQPDTA